MNGDKTNILAIKAMLQSLSLLTTGSRTPNLKYVNIAEQYDTDFQPFSMPTESRYIEITKS